MLINDLILIFQWWVTILIIGTIFLPLTFLIFSKFLDRGYLFSKVIGIAIISYIVFILGLLKILKFTNITIIFVLAVSLLINLLLIKLYQHNFFNKLKESFKIILFEETIFLLGLVFWSYIRAHQPNINGLEKFMDFGFVNSILRSDYFPPRDMWFTPLPINYYYFGHLVTALITKLSNIKPSISYNLMIATLFSFTFSLSFSLVFNFLGLNIAKPKNIIEKFKNKLHLLQNFESKLKINKYLILSGLLGGFIVAFSGNLHTIYTFFTAYNTENPQPVWNHSFSVSSFPNNYWYPNATRFIPFTIHEFPMYSFVVSDLHGHVLDIPFVLLTIALLFSIFNQIKNNNNSNSFQIFNFQSKILLISFLLAILYMTNVWDGIIYFLLTGFVLLYLIFNNPFSNSWEKFKTITINFIRAGSRMKTITGTAQNSKIIENSNTEISLKIENWNLKIYELIKYIAIIFLGFIIFSLPFNLNFKPFASGIGVICAPEFLVKIGKIGPFLFEANHCQKSPLWQLLILYGFFYFFVFSFTYFIFSKKLKLQKNDIFIFILIALSTILILIPELIYIKDIYPSHYRANTMFKLVYQSFIMLSLSSTYIIIRLIANFKWFNWKLVVLVIIGSIGLFLVMIYPYFAINSYYGNLKNYSGLDGIVYLQNTHPDDYKAIVWINENIENQPVLLEAQGDSYTDYERISSNTGLVTILGWTVHEWLWRGTYDIPAPRIEEIKNIYESTDINLTASLIKKYNVLYVYIGKLEREKYPNINEEKFKKLGKIVYQNNEVNLYKLNY